MIHRPRRVVIADFVSPSAERQVAFRGLRKRKPNDCDFWPKVYCQSLQAGVGSYQRPSSPAAITGTGVKTPEEREAQRRAWRPATTGRRRPGRVDQAGLRRLA